MKTRMILAALLALLLMSCNHDNPIDPTQDAPSGWVHTQTYMYAMSHDFDFISVETLNDSMPHALLKRLPVEMKIVNHSDRDTTYYTSSIVSYVRKSDSTNYSYYAKIMFADPNYTQRFQLAASMDLSVYVRFE